MSKYRKDAISYLNIIVIGKENSGKSAFVRTLCERIKDQVVQDTFKESSPGTLEGPLRPTEELYSVSMQLEQDGSQQRTALTIIDTQGLVKGFVLGHQLRYLAKYIDHQLQRFLVEETKVKRNLNPPDTRIHACFYFIDTNTTDGLNDVDQLAIELLSSRVNVIPIIGKTDTLSTRQVDQLKKNFRKQVFDVYKIPLYGVVSLDDDEETSNDSTDSNERAPSLALKNQGGFRLASPHYGKSNNNNSSSSSSSSDDDDSTTIRNLVEMLQEVVESNSNNNDAHAMIDYLKRMPLSVFGYEEDKNTGRPITITQDMKPSTSQNTDHLKTRNETSDSNKGTTTSSSILGRVYPWAVVDCCDPAYCDFERLLGLLLSGHGDMLRLDTVERFYEQYRIDQLLSRRVEEMVKITPKSNQHQDVD